MFSHWVEATSHSQGQKREHNREHTIVCFHSQGQGGEMFSVVPGYNRAWLLLLLCVC